MMNDPFCIQYLEGRRKIDTNACSASKEQSYSAHDNYIIISMLLIHLVGGHATKS